MEGLQAHGAAVARRLRRRRRAAGRLRPGSSRSTFGEPGAPAAASRHRAPCVNSSGHGTTDIDARQEARRRHEATGGAGAREAGGEGGRQGARQPRRGDDRAHHQGDQRRASRSRSTARAAARSSTGVPFLDHMLDLFAKHGFFDLTVQATGDLEVDQHHTVEDVGLTLGQAFREALGDKEGIRRFGQATRAARRGAGVGRRRPERAAVPGLRARARARARRQLRHQPGARLPARVRERAEAEPARRLHPRPQPAPHDRGGVQGARRARSTWRRSSIRASRACCRPRACCDRDRRLRRRQPAQRRQGARARRGRRAARASTCASARRPREIERARRGRAAGRRCVRRLHDEPARVRLDDVVAARDRSGKPFLGICVGMQILFEESEEFGPVAGLGVLPGQVVRFRSRDVKIPHMGWNALSHAAGAAPALAGIPTGPTSTSCTRTTPSRPIRRMIAATATYGGEEFTAAVGARQPVRDPVPSREEPGRPGSRCSATSSAPPARRSQVAVPA